MTPIEIYYGLKKLFSAVKSKKYKILSSFIFGGILGVIIYLYSPNRYLSEVTFIVEESKGSTSGLASIAGQFGIDVGGVSSNSVFSGDNVQHFFRSKELCRQVLLSKYDEKRLLIDIYLKTTKLTNLASVSYLKNGQSIFRNESSLDSNTIILRDSILSVCTKRILKNNFNISKLDKKSSVLIANVTFGEEQFSKIFLETIMKIATDKYVNSKTKLKYENVKRLEMRADSLERILNSQTYSVADYSQGLIDVNPALKTLLVQNEISSRSKNVAASLYLEVTKNLELSKIALMQVTPTIEIVDQTRYPLKNLKKNIFIYTFICSIFFGLIHMLMILVSFLFRKK